MTWGDDIAAKLLGSAVPAGFTQCYAMWEAVASPCEIIGLDELKTILGIVDTSQDAELQRLIDVYSASIANYLERQVCTGDREACFVARGVCRTPTLRLPQFPVTEVTSVDVDGAVKDPSEYFINGRTGDLYSSAGNWTASQYVLVKYVGGYDPIPADLQNAAVDMINNALNSSGTSETGPLKSQRVEGAVTEQYYDARESGDTATSDSGSADVGKYSAVLDYYRGERAFF